ILVASRLPSTSVSPRATPSKTTSPAPISATTPSSTVTRASDTRWQTARMSGHHRARPDSPALAPRPVSSSPATRSEVLARAAPPGWGCFTHHPLRSSLLLNRAPRADAAAPNLRRLLGGVRSVLVLVQVVDARRVMLVLWAEGARQL